MKCPFCGHANDKVVDSRESKDADSIRRRRECLKCEKRFTTYERIDEIPYMVVKKDGRREKFDRQKVLNGLLRACEKRPVPISKLEQIVNEAEAFIIESPERERKTSEVGELIMNRLRRYDKVAYVRFASVYLDAQRLQAQHGRRQHHLDIAMLAYLFVQTVHQQAGLRHIQVHFPVANNQELARHVCPSTFL